MTWRGCVASAIVDREGLRARGEQARNRIVTEFSIEQLVSTTSGRLLGLLRVAG